MDNKREILGWTMYDWANSAFSSTVVTTFLGPYLNSLAQAQGGVNILGYRVEGAAFFPFCVSVSVILQVLFLPLLGTIADYTNLRKRLMMTFAYTGAVATMLLFTVQGDLVIWGGFLFIIANLCFGAAIVFYNAFLPDIASPDNRDSVSSRGFALGYLGGGLVLVVNLGLFSYLDGQDLGGLAVRLNLASAGVWWLIFAYIFPHRLLVQREPARQLPSGTSLLKHGVGQLLTTFKDMWYKYPHTLRYLIAFLIYNDGIQTVIVVSTQFAEDELSAPISVLTGLILMIQFVAFGGALLFNLIAKRVGTKQAIVISLVIWSGIVIYAYGFLYSIPMLWVLGFVLALVLGGSQALSRSLFSQMIPKDHEAEYFGFYEISERGTSWVGTLTFGLAVQITGNQRVAIISLIIFFVVGLILLSVTNIKQAILDSGNELPSMI